MDFGQKVLKKYGWSEGEGLGKNSDGIKEAIKPKRKANNLGLGFKLGTEFKDNWWENVYDNAASNVIVKTDEGAESVKHNILMVSIHNKFLFPPMLRNYGLDLIGIFYKYSAYGLVDPKEDPENGTCSVTKSENSKDTTQAGIMKNKYRGFQKAKELTSDEDSDFENKTSLLTDDEIFKKCGGRTVHKGARHGLTLSGKLSRIQEQEKRLLKKELVDNSTTNTKKKKIK